MIGSSAALGLLWGVKARASSSSSVEDELRPLRRKVNELKARWRKDEDGSSTFFFTRLRITQLRYITQ